jgi:hypothetical protein
MLTLKEKARIVDHWDLVFEYRAEEYRAYLSRLQGPTWHAGIVPSELKDELEEWRWKEQERIDRLRSELPTVPLNLISEALGNAGVREDSLEAWGGLFLQVREDKSGAGASVAIADEEHARKRHAADFIVDLAPDDRHSIPRAKGLELMAWLDANRVAYRFEKSAA